ncbi:alpha/beta fold hydrolase [Amycolatopsis pithecellobii]|uniref:Alpha/beta fold hydrolase n=1 Tax=Amycolatopsis pithecellobii TaxID=664692 RepID=A0A6N7YMY6_9PSEU|nr:alpha/beta fold hydrolase [Amycolatopsis pithecellobii]MTD53228.1 alpha/beta fold hydrolase [Amycolatopsis pithecellobii]
MARETIFVLVHGGSHGAWCWQRVIGALDTLGHSAVAMDLPSEDETAGAGRYAEVVLEALADLDGDLVLVGHSLGGLTIPLVATERPVRKMIFLSGALPIPGRTLLEQLAAEPEMLLFSPQAGPSAYRDGLYNAAGDADAAWALTQIRPQAEMPFRETTPLRVWPDTESAYVVPTEDHAVNPVWARRAARERLGIEAHEMIGADHSPFLSRPAELARLLVELARPH